MPFAQGNVATIQIDNAGGTLTDISTYLRQVTPSYTRKISELPRLGGAQVAQLTGPMAARWRLRGWYDPTVSAIFRAAQGDATPNTLSLAYGPQGSASGLDKDTAEVYVASYEPDTDAEEPGAWTAEVVANEAGVTFGTF